MTDILIFKSNIFTVDYCLKYKARVDMKVKDVLRRRQ